MLHKRPKINDAADAAAQVDDAKEPIPGVRNSLNRPPWKNFACVIEWKQVSGVRGLDGKPSCSCACCACLLQPVGKAALKGPECFTTGHGRTISSGR